MLMKMIPKTAFKKGHTPWHKGTKIDRRKHPQFGHFVKHTEESKEKNRLAHLGKKYPNRKLPNRFTKEHIKNLSNSHKGLNTWSKGRRLSKKHRERVLSAIQKRWLSKEPTSIEKKVYDELKARGLLFEKQKLIEGKFFVDAFIPILNLVIEADGNYWHGLERTKKYDKAKNAYLKTCGFNLLRLTETEINDGSFKERLNLCQTN